MRDCVREHPVSEWHGSIIAKRVGENLFGDDGGTYFMPRHARDPRPNGTTYLRSWALFGWSHRSGWKERGLGK